MIFDFYTVDDFGKDYCFAFLKFKRYSLIQTSIGWQDYTSKPMLYFTMGGNGFISFFFYIHKFSFCFDLITFNWPKRVVND